MAFIDKYTQQIAELCKNYNVEKLYVFGSAQSGSLTSTSDVDVLVKFKRFDVAKYFENYMGLKRRLQELFDRDVDLVEEQSLSNPYLIESINRNKELIYG